MTFNGVVVREGTVCELDRYCWASKKSWDEMECPPTQPPAAAQASITTLLGLQEDTRSKVGRTSFG